jgi:membrane-bound lytic murein transglycosylase A
MDTASLRHGALQSLAYYRSLPADHLFILGPDTYTAKAMADSMSTLAKILEKYPDSKDWLPMLLRDFTVYQSIGTDEKRKIVFTSYFEPTIQARLTRDEIFKFPLYRRPDDLLDVDLSLFDSNYQGVRVVGRREGRSLIPYYKRSEIQTGKTFVREGLELAWARDAFDVLDLQIEGSGWLDLGNGERLRIRYDGDNGHRFRSVGQYLISTGRIPKHKFSREAFREYLKKHPGETQKLLNVNDRFIFFQLDTSSSAPYAFGHLRVPLTAGRSMATDPKLFPKGALAWIQVSREQPVQRFMLNQDEGGAIQGPGRVDIFAGAGEKALSFANRLMNEGSLYFFVKKSSQKPRL